MADEVDARRMNAVSKLFLYSTAILTLGLIGLKECSSRRDYSVSSELANEVYESRPISKEKKRDFVFREGPVYSDEQVPANICSRYVRLAAKDLFGIEYPSADAWDIRDDSRVKEIRLDGTNSLEWLIDSGNLKPGMLVGVYNPTSRYNQRASQDGAGYTHVMLYLGNDGGEPFFADKFGKKTRPKISLKDLNDSGLKPREILFIDL